MDVTLIETGVANTASIRAALARVGAEVRFTTNPGEVSGASRVVLPGVGHFAAGAARLRDLGLDTVLRERIEAGRPTLAICLGLQLLCEGSDEAPGVPGIGAVPQVVRPLTGRVLPQLGWNQVRPEPGLGFSEPGSAYFANSFALDRAPAGWRACWSTYGQPFIAAIEREGVLACQFHPELSGAWGQAWISRWLEGAPVPVDPNASSAPRPPGTRLIPCLDVRDGRVVKGVQFQGLRDAGDPADQAEVYARQGADELVILDVSATDEGRRACVETVRAVRGRIGLPLTVGGGVRTIEDAERLLAAGADKISVNSAAVARPVLLEELAARFGRQCTVVAIDARRLDSRWEVMVRGGKSATSIDAVRWAEQAQMAGAGEILLTSVDRDGTQSGYDLELVRAVSARTSIPVIASGGARTALHLSQAVHAGASAVLAASILHDNQTTIQALKQGMQQQGCEVRA